MKGSWGGGKVGREGGVKGGMGSLAMINHSRRGGVGEGGGGGGGVLQRGQNPHDNNGTSCTPSRHARASSVIDLGWTEACAAAELLEPRTARREGTVDSAGTPPRRRQTAAAIDLTVSQPLLLFAASFFFGAQSSSVAQRPSMPVYLRDGSVQITGRAGTLR